MVRTLSAEWLRDDHRWPRREWFLTESISQRNESKPMEYEDILGSNDDDDEDRLGTKKKSKELA